MAVNFNQESSNRLSDLQDQVTQKETQVKELIIQHRRELAEANKPLETERAAHAITLAELENAMRKLQELNAKLDRGIQKHGDWDEVAPSREICSPSRSLCSYADCSQTWLDFLQSNNYEMSAMKKAYHLSCVQHNINRGARNGILRPLYYVPKDSVRQERGLLVDPEKNFEIGKSFPFQRLIDEAPKIAREIAIKTMKKGSVVHFLARLDVTEPYPPPEGGRCRVTNLPMRFWCGPGRKVHINSAPTFEETLAPCHVSRDFMEIFGSAFWSQNKFAFASFGELNIFRRNARTSYIQRIQSVEIWWQGSRGDYPIDWGPESNDHFDRRTWPLSILTAMHRLKSLEVYVDESSKKAQRRAKEPQFVQNPLLDVTRGQDNNRTYRDLRKLQGMDYVYQLRNLKMVRFYDSAQADRRVEVRDETFVKDVRQQVTQPKSRRRGREARFENLKPMLRRNLAEEPLYIAKAPVQWIAKSMFYPTLQWNPAEYPDLEQSSGGGNGGRGGGRDRDEAGEHGKVGEGGALEGNGETDHQGGDGPDSDSCSDSSADPDILFGGQDRNDSVVTQAKGFQGRRAMGMDVRGALNDGFGGSQRKKSQLLKRGRSVTRYGQGPFIDDSDDESVVVTGNGSTIFVSANDDNDYDEVIIDEERSAPRPDSMWGQHFDLTGDNMKKENDDDASQQSNGQSTLPQVAQYTQAEAVKVEAGENAILFTPANAKREVPSLHKKPRHASRAATPSSFGGTPTSSRLAAEEAIFNSFNFGSPSPPAGMGTPCVSTSGPGSSYSSNGSLSTRSSTSKRSREEDDSTPTAVDNNVGASSSRCSSRSFIAGGAITATVARNIDEMDFDEMDLDGRADGARDTRSHKHRRRNVESDTAEELSNMTDSWLMTFSH